LALNVPFLPVYVPPKILQRAQEILAEGGAVGDVHQTPHSLTATVYGSYPYDVAIDLDAGEPCEWRCSCPYEYGEVCKHVAALWLGAQQGAFAKQLNATTSEQSTLKLALKATRKRDLVAGLLQLTHRDAELRTALLAQFGEDDEPDAENLVEKLNKALTRFEHKESDPFGYMHAHALATVFTPYFREIEDYVRTEQHQACWVLAKAVAEETLARFNYIDDSSGALGGVHARATKALLALGEAPLEEELRFECLDYCIYHVKQRTHADWDYHVDLMHLGCTLVSDDDELADMLQAMEGAQGYYEAEQAAVYSIKMFQRLGDVAAAEDLIANSLQHAQVRRLAIKAAFAKTDYEAVERLARGGLEQRDAPGYFGDWNHWLFRVATARGRVEDQVALLCEAYINDQRNFEDPLAKIRALVTPERWQLLVDELAAALTSQSRRGDRGRLYELLVVAERFEALTSRILKQPTLQKLAYGAEHLPQSYHRQLALAHLPLIDELLKRGADPHLYAYIVDALARVVQLGARKEARGMVDHIRSRYKRRKLLLRLLKEGGW